MATAGLKRRQRSGIASRYLAAIESANAAAANANATGMGHALQHQQTLHPLHRNQAATEHLGSSGCHQQTTTAANPSQQRQQQQQKKPERRRIGRNQSRDDDDDDDPSSSTASASASDNDESPLLRPPPTKWRGGGSGWQTTAKAAAAAAEDDRRGSFEEGNNSDGAVDDDVGMQQQLLLVLSPDESKRSKASTIRTAITAQSTLEGGSSSAASSTFAASASAAAAPWCAPSSLVGGGGADEDEAGDGGTPRTAPAYDLSGSAYDDEDCDNDDGVEGGGGGDGSSGIHRWKAVAGTRRSHSFNARTPTRFFPDIVSPPPPRLPSSAGGGIAVKSIVASNSAGNCNGNGEEDTDHSSLTKDDSMNDDSLNDGSSNGNGNNDGASPPAKSGRATSTSTSSSPESDILVRQPPLPPPREKPAAVAAGVAAGGARRRWSPPVKSKSWTTTSRWGAPPPPPPDAAAADDTAVRKNGASGSAAASIQYRIQHQPRTAMSGATAATTRRRKRGADDKPSLVESLRSLFDGSNVDPFWTYNCNADDVAAFVALEQQQEEEERGNGNNARPQRHTHPRQQWKSWRQRQKQQSRLPPPATATAGGAPSRPYNRPVQSFEVDAGDTTFRGNAAASATSDSRSAATQKDNDGNKNSSSALFGDATAPEHPPAEADAEADAEAAAQNTSDTKSDITAASTQIFSNRAVDVAMKNIRHIDQRCASASAAAAAATTIDDRGGGSSSSSNRGSTGSSGFDKAGGEGTAKAASSLSRRPGETVTTERNGLRGHLNTSSAYHYNQHQHPQRYIFGEPQVHPSQLEAQSLLSASSAEESSPRAEAVTQTQMKPLAPPLGRKRLGAAPLTIQDPAAVRRQQPHQRYHHRLQQQQQQRQPRPRPRPLPPAPPPSNNITVQATSASAASGGGTAATGRLGKHVERMSTRAQQRQPNHLEAQSPTTFDASRTSSMGVEIKYDNHTKNPTATAATLAKNVWMKKSRTDILLPELSSVEGSGSFSADKITTKTFSVKGCEVNTSTEGVLTELCPSPPDIVRSTTVQCHQEIRRFHQVEDGSMLSSPDPIFCSIGAPSSRGPEPLIASPSTANTSSGLDSSNDSERATISVGEVPATVPALQKDKWLPPFTVEVRERGGDHSDSPDSIFNFEKLTQKQEDMDEDGSSSSDSRIVPQRLFTSSEPINAAAKLADGMELKHSPERPSQRNSTQSGLLLPCLNTASSLDQHQIRENKRVAAYLAAISKSESHLDNQSSDYGAAENLEEEKTAYGKNQLPESCFSSRLQLHMSHSQDRAKNADHDTSVDFLSIKSAFESLHNSSAAMDDDDDDEDTVSVRSLRERYEAPKQPEADNENSVKKMRALFESKISPVAKRSDVVKTGPLKDTISKFDIQPSRKSNAFSLAKPREVSPEAEKVYPTQALSAARIRSFGVAHVARPIQGATTNRVVTPRGFETCRSQTPRANTRSAHDNGQLDDRGVLCTATSDVTSLSSSQDHRFGATSETRVETQFCEVKSEVEFGAAVDFAPVISAEPIESVEKAPPKVIKPLAAKPVTEQEGDPPTQPLTRTRSALLRERISMLYSKSRFDLQVPIDDPVARPSLSKNSMYTYSLTERKTSRDDDKTSESSLVNNAARERAGTSTELAVESEPLEAENDIRASTAEEHDDDSCTCRDNSAKLEHCESGSESGSDEFSDGVTLDLSIAEVSNLTNPTALVSRTGDPSVGTEVGEFSDQGSKSVDLVESEAKRSEASSSQTSEAAAPLIAKAMRMRPMSDEMSANSFFAKRALIAKHWSKTSGWDNGHQSVSAVNVAQEKKQHQGAKEVENLDDNIGSGWDVNRIESSFPVTNTAQPSDSGGLFDFDSDWQPFSPVSPASETWRAPTTPSVNNANQRSGALSPRSKTPTRSNTSIRTTELQANNTVKNPKPGTKTPQPADRNRKSSVLFMRTHPRRSDQTLKRRNSLQQQVPASSIERLPVRLPQSQQRNTSTTNHDDEQDVHGQMMGHHAALMARLRSLKEARLRRMEGIARSTSLSGTSSDNGYGHPLLEHDEYSNSTKSSTQFGGSTFLASLDVD